METHLDLATSAHEAANMLSVRLCDDVRVLLLPQHNAAILHHDGQRLATFHGPYYRDFTASEIVRDIIHREGVSA